MIKKTSSSGIPNFEKPKKINLHVANMVDVSSFDSKLPPRIKRMLKKFKQQQGAVE